LVEKTTGLPQVTDNFITSSTPRHEWG
jgi:hypothetical protein